MAANHAYLSPCRSPRLPRAAQHLRLPILPSPRSGSGRLHRSTLWNYFRGAYGVRGASRSGEACTSVRSRPRMLTVKDGSGLGVRGATRKERFRGAFHAGGVPRRTEVSIRRYFTDGFLPFCSGSLAGQHRLGRGSGATEHAGSCAARRRSRLRAVLAHAYRENFRPSDRFAEPHAILAASVVCADTDERAEELASSMGLAWVRMRTGKPGPLPSPEEAMGYPYTPRVSAACSKTTAPCRS